MIRTLAIKLDSYDRKIFWILLTGIAISAFFYAYFLAHSVFSVIERNKLERNGAALNARISNLETQYVALGTRIDLALAHEKGFVDIAAPQYLTPTKPDTTLTLRGNEHF